MSYPSQNTLTVASLVGLANNAMIPCIFYFCSLHSRNPRGAYPSPPEILLDMVQSLILQLLLLPEPSMTLELQRTEFERLLNPVDLGEALGLLHKLR